MKVDANAVRKEIKERGLTQKGLCKKLNVSPEHFNRRISRGDIPDHWYNLIYQSGVVDCGNEKALRKIANMIADKRREMGISQMKLAELSGLNIGTIQGYEQGRYTPKLDSALKLCRVLDIQISNILSDNKFCDELRGMFINNSEWMEVWRNELPFAIKEKRKERGLTQKELANMTGLAEITIRQYEAGKFEPKRDTMLKLQKVLGGVAMGTVIYTFGEKMAMYRRAKGITQQELAEKIGVTQSQIGQWERGVRNPTGKSKIKICDALGTSIDVLQSDWDVFGSRDADAIGEYYNSLNAKGKALIIDILKMIASTTKYQKDVTLCQSDCDTMAP